MNKKHLHTKIQIKTKEKLEGLSKELGISMGQLIDLMTRKTKVR